jgi:glycosyltransferase involved in cell wall biosynthesis
VAGANHHTKAGYWESIREAQPPHLPIEFRGYVPEEDIPELFRTTSVLVLPYDSATGSSGPAHQACEYGVPIIGADIEDFRDMGADEDMAIRFYKVGDATDLANQLITVLRSHELQRSMGQQNFAAGLEMTIGRVVRNYLRWFELNKYKRALVRSTENRGSWFRSLFSRNTVTRPESAVKSGNSGDSHGLEPAGNNTQAIDFVDPLV